MLVAEFLELLEINLIGQDTQRVVSRPLVAQAAQSVSQPLPAIPHGYHPSPVVNLTPLRNGVGRAAALTGVIACRRLPVHASLACPGATARAQHLAGGAMVEPGTWPPHYRRAPRCPRTAISSQRWPPAATCKREASTVFEPREQRT
jgi:hypothetical protein